MVGAAHVVLVVVIAIPPVEAATALVGLEVGKLGPGAKKPIVKMICNSEKSTAASELGVWSTLGHG